MADPVYPYYHKRTEMLDATPTFVSSDPDGTLDPVAIRDAVDEDTAAIVINSPNNPTGGVYGRERKRELAAIAEASDALLVSDEVYNRFVYDEGAFETALSLDSENLVVTNAFSKSMAITGFRVGYGIYPATLTDVVRTRHMLVNVAGSRPAQRAALDALRETPESYYERNRRLLDERIGTFCAALDRAGAEYSAPERRLLRDGALRRVSRNTRKYGAVDRRGRGRRHARGRLRRLARSVVPVRDRDATSGGGR